MSIVVNQPLTLECEASGIPEPTITWVREGARVSYLGNPNLRELNGGRKLQVVNAQLQDIGGYTCVASNVAGNASKEFVVNVLGEYNDVLVMSASSLASAF
jgi:hemicentin